jgi:NAD(P)-dependent dehydrogenase (short-subunit alcohol dehydrogenase family)
MDYFANKRAAITGAGDGIGRQLAIQLNRAGCELWLCDINPEALEETLTQLPRRDTPAHGATVDCGDRDALYGWAEDVAQQTHHLDALFNNAGVAYAARFEDSTDDNFEWLMRINYWGVVWGTRAFLPLLLAAPSGHLVNLSSVFGLVGIPSQSAYNSAKFAVRGFSEALQAEYKDGPLKVSCVHPGGIATNIARRARTDGEAASADPDERDRNFQQHTRTSAARAAEIILSGTARGRRRILVGPDATFLHWLIRFFPSSYHWLTARLDQDVV